MPAEPEIKMWADSLERLLQEAANAAQSGNTKKIVAVQRSLRKFKEDSPDYADALDTQASLAIFDLDLSVTEDAVANIQSRAAEVYKLGKLISGIAEEANSNVVGLRATLVQAVLDSVAPAVGSFKGLRDQLLKSKGKSADSQLAQEIGDLLMAIQQLRNKLEAS